MDHYLQQLKYADFPMPYANNISDAPLFKDGFPDLVKTPSEYIARAQEIGVCTIGKSFSLPDETEKYEKSLSVITSYSIHYTKLYEKRR